MISALDTSLLQKTRQVSENSAELDDFLKQLSQTADDNAIDRVISLYKKTIVTLEQEIWKTKATPENIEQYQNAFIVLEKLHELKTADTRYNFKIVIPVADRPQHLKQCLHSLLTLCKSYGYGGFKDKQFNKISVLIADDSRNPDNIKHHKSYCNELSAQGINTEYFGLKEQLTLVTNATTENDSLARIISDAEDINDPVDFSHKGASIMRNITYLKLREAFSRDKKNKNTLIYFIDSDQEFCIHTINSDNNSNSNFYAINYFHYLNEIFKTQDISILTGKVVGDPPVSPSVMAGNFQQDIQNFLNALEKLKPDNPCQFHQRETDSKDDAAYHDMANLFGFSKHEQAFDYHCTLQGEHNNADCFHDFSDKLGHFFYGEHPTRKTFFHYENGFSTTTPARTVYTGNYVIKPENLDFFIPFATLKLRMAGPVLGRILNASLHGKFVSANLPMLHNRTVDSTGQSEFRAGVKNHGDTTGYSIDLGNEFIRQFYGDVMLFSIMKITEHDLPSKGVDSHSVQSIIDATYDNIKASYIEKHNTVLQLKSQLQAQLNNQACWWNNLFIEAENINQAKINFNNFLENIQSNFDENSFAYQQVFPSNQATKYLESILDAILHYQHDMDAWKRYLTLK
jgi:uncharacterized protein YjaG (DUF416 family)